MTRCCPGCGSTLLDDGVIPFCARCLVRVSLRNLDNPEQAAGPDLALATAALGAHLRPHRQLGDFELLEEVAQGGSAVVWRAKQRSLGRFVALKLLRTASVAKAEDRKRFRGEAAAIASLQHPNIVALYDFGEYEGQPWISMEFVEGPTLAEVIRRGTSSPESAATLLRCLAQALTYAHQRGVLHRDIKPSNILLDPSGLPRITDFGIAKRLGEPSQLPWSNPPLTRSGQLLGTPNYAPPEQLAVSSKSTGPPSDIYGLGAVLYELLTGRPPFSGLTLEATLLQVISVDPIPPRSLNPAVPLDLQTICLKCLEKVPAHRYATAQELSDELGRFLRSEPIAARPIGGAERAWRWARRNRALAIALVTTTAVLLAGFAATAWQWRRAEQSAAVTASALTRLEIERAEAFFESNETESALAYLAQVLRQNPSNRVAAERALSAIMHRNFPLPLCAPLTHAGPVLSARFSPDGTRVVTASADHTAKIWEVRTGVACGPALQHQGIVSYAEFDPSGTRVLTASEDGTSALWEVSTATLVGPPLRHTGPVKFAQFSPDGSRIVTASADGTARIWNGASGIPLGAPLVHSNAVVHARFSPDGQFVITASVDGTAGIWTADEGRLVRTIRHGELAYAEFSPDQSRVVTVAVRGSAKVWDTQTGELISEIPTGPFWMNSGRFSRDGQRLLIAYAERFAGLWQLGKAKPLNTPLPHDGGVFAASFSPQEDRIITASEDGSAAIWDATTGRRLLPRLRHGGAVLSAEFSPDGRKAVTGSKDGSAMLWSIEPTSALPATMAHPAGVYRAYWSPEGEHLLTLCRDHVSRVWRRSDGTVRSESRLHKRNLMNAAFSSDGGRIITASRDHTATVWDARTGDLLAGPLAHARVVWDAVFSPNGRWAATASWDGKVKIWDANTGVLRGPPLEFGAAVSCVRFSPHGDQLVAGGDRGAKIFDFHTGKEGPQKLHHDGDVYHVQFSPDGARILTGSTDGTARIWHARTGELVQTLQHPSAVCFACFSVDGRLVATCAFDRAARLWDATTGRLVTGPLRHSDRLFSASFSPDGLRLATAGYDHAARIWDTRTGHPLSEPFVHKDVVYAANFSPDGQSLATASDDGFAQIWATPSLPGPVPPWFIEWIEALAGQQIHEDGTRSTLPSAQLVEIGKRIQRMNDADAYVRWARSFFSRASTDAVASHLPARFR